MKKILIIDWDVHYGQSVQQVFYNNSNVLCVSIHRHQQGTFWPYMREAEWNRTGSFEGEGFNVNIPLDEVNLDDKDYLAVFRHIIVPIALEFQPDLVFVSAGFDGAVGCPFGNMRVSPQAFGYFMKMLMLIAGSRLVVALEGGYSVDSLKWSVMCVIRALLHDPLFELSDINVPVTPSVANAIHLVETALRIQWNCMSAFVGTITKCLLRTESRPLDVTVPKFIGDPDMAEEEGVPETPSSSNVAQIRSAISYLMAQTTAPSFHVHCFGNRPFDSARRNSAVIAGDFSYNYVVNAITNLVSSTLGECDFRRPLVISTEGHEMLFKRTYSDGRTCLWTNMAFLPPNEACRLKDLFSRRTEEKLFYENSFCAKVDLPIVRLEEADRLFLFHQLLWPTAYAHHLDLVVMEVDFANSFYFDIQPSLSSYIISHLTALAGGRLIIIVSAKADSYNIEEYLSSILAPLAGSSFRLEDDVGTGPVSKECISMAASANCQLERFYPMLKCIFLPSSENAQTTSNSSRIRIAYDCSSSARKVPSKRKCSLPEGESSSGTAFINDDSNTNGIVSKRRKLERCKITDILRLNKVG